MLGSLAGDQLPPNDKLTCPESMSAEKFTHFLELKTLWNSNPDVETVNGIKAFLDLGDNCSGRVRSKKKK